MLFWRGEIMSQGTEFRKAQASVLEGRSQGCWGCSNYFIPSELRKVRVAIVEYKHIEIEKTNSSNEYREEVIRKRTKDLCDVCSKIYSKYEWDDKK